MCRCTIMYLWLLLVLQSIFLMVGTNGKKERRVRVPFRMDAYTPPSAEDHECDMDRCDGVRLLSRCGVVWFKAVLIKYNFYYRARYTKYSADTRNHARDRLKPRWPMVINNIVMVMVMVIKIVIVFFFSPRHMYSFGLYTIVTLSNTQSSSSLIVLDCCCYDCLRPFLPSTVWWVQGSCWQNQ